MRGDALFCSLFNKAAPCGVFPDLHLLLARRADGESLHKRIEQGMGDEKVRYMVIIDVMHRIKRIDFFS